MSRYREIYRKGYLIMEKVLEIFDKITAFLTGADFANALKSINDVFDKVIVWVAELIEKAGA